MGALTNIIGFISLGIQAATCVGAIWAAVLIFRHRGPAGWLAIVGSILAAITSILSPTWAFLAHRIFALNPSDQWLYIGQAFYIFIGVGHLMFVSGVLLHLLRGKLEAERIEQLEAIIHDRDKDQAP